MIRNTTTVQKVVELTTYRLVYCKTSDVDNGRYKTIMKAFTTLIKSELYQGLQ